MKRFHRTPVVKVTTILKVSDTQKERDVQLVATLFKSMVNEGITDEVHFLNGYVKGRHVIDNMRKAGVSFAQSANSVIAFGDDAKPALPALTRSKIALTRSKIALTRSKNALTAFEERLYASARCVSQIRGSSFSNGVKDLPM